MKRWIAVAGLVAAVAVGGAAFAHQDVINARREGLKGMAAHMEAIKALADSRGDPRGAVARIDQMIVFYQTFGERFPAGTDRGETRALPAVWSDRPGFEKARSDMVAQLQALRVASVAGDPAGFGRAFQQTGAACGACHRPFRAPAR